MKKEIFKGIIAGFVSTLIGIVICVFIVSQIRNLPFTDTFNFYLDNDTLWMLLSLGALPNLLIFFWFLKKNREYNARGVLLTTFIVAITAYLIYFL